MGVSLANKISILRILLVPFFVACLFYYRPAREWLRYAAAGLFLIGAVSDAVDGYLARAQGQWTRLGTLLDPLADKLMLLTAFLSLAAIPTIPDDLRVPAWVVITVVARDLFLLAGSGVVYYLTGRLEVQPVRLGKWATFTQMLVILVVLLRWPYAAVLWWAAALLTIASGIVYLRRGARLLNNA